MTPPAPRQQTIYAYGISLIFMLLGSLSSPSGSQFAWTASAAFILLFSILNSIISIFSENYAQYFQESLLCFTLLLLASGASAWLLSGQTISQTPPYRTIYLVLVIAYGAFLALCFMLRQIADYLKRKDEEQHGI